MERHYHFSNMSMEDLLYHLNADQLRQVHKIHLDFAERALIRAKKLEARSKMERECKRQLQDLSKIPELMLRAIEGGANYQTAAAQVAAQFGCPTDTALMRWDGFLKSTKREYIALRRRLVFSLAANGYSNPETAAHINMHSGSVCRILGSVKRKRAALNAARLNL